MASLQQKRPSISNWFSSLRRQPRHKKHATSGSFGNKQQLQRSCFDLSTQTSAFYITTPSAAAAAAKAATAASVRDATAGGLHAQILSGAPSAAASADNLLDDTDRRRLVKKQSDGSNGSRDADPLLQFCARCCCNIMGSNAANERAQQALQQAPATSPMPKKVTNVKARSPSLTPHTSVATYNVAPIANIETPTTPETPTGGSGSSSSTATMTTTTLTAQSPGATSTLSEHTVRCADVSRNEQVTRLPCAELNTALYQKRSEYTHTTTTTTTRTLIVSRPVELLLNENGEIIARRPAASALKRKPRSNSVGCMLERDDGDDVGNDDDASVDVEAENDIGNKIVVDILKQDAEADAGDAFSRQRQQQQQQQQQAAESPLSPLLSSIIGNDAEFRFIDDSSNSQSESERNSVQRQVEPQTEEIKQLPPNSSDSTNNNNLNNNNNNNNNSNNNNYNNSEHNNDNNNDDSKSNLNLCDVCRSVVARNSNNAELQSTFVILRRPKQIKDELCEVVSEMEALDVPEDCKHSNKDKQMSIGRKKFNMDPKKGIEYLVENRLLRHDAQDVAHFLYKGEGLNKTAIGDYLGEKNDFNEDVLKAFVALHDFTNLILVQALRQFLWSFRLPGEAQKIDRMMECFAQRYCQLNPDIFTNTDTCYVLSFAIIMLNTSLHNPSVKDKPTVEQFISMNRGINNGGDLPRGLLESLYESIRTEPFKIPQDDGNDLMHTFFNPDKEGWLWKQGGRYKSWKRRWFILNDNCLYYFEYTTDKEPRGIIPLENISVREINDRSKPYCFELFATGGADIIKACKTDSEGKVVEGKHSVYRMSAATEEDQQEWIKRLTQSISHNPFYDILVQRKKKALSKS